MILSVIFPPDDQEQEAALHLDPTVPALMPALMLTNQFAGRVPGVAKPATESLKKLTVTNNHFGSPFHGGCRSSIMAGDCTIGAEVAFAQKCDRRRGWEVYVNGHKK